MKKLCCVICGKYRTFEKLKVSYLLEKHKFFLLYVVSGRLEESIEILNIINLKTWLQKT